MKVELFVAGCRLCNEARFQYEQRFPHWEIETHRADECTDGSCCQKAARYGLTAVPSLVLDGHLVQTGNPTEEDLLRLERMFWDENKATHTFINIHGYGHTPMGSMTALK